MKRLATHAKGRRACAQLQRLVASYAGNGLMIEGVSSLAHSLQHISAQNSTPFAAGAAFFDGLC